MRVLFFAEMANVHVARFLGKLADTEHEVFFLPTWAGGDIDRFSHHIHVLPPLASAGLEIRWVHLRTLSRVLKEVTPHVVHAGPLPTCAFFAARVGARRLLSMSWGWDLLSPDCGPLQRARNRLALRHSVAAVCDCESLRQAILTDTPELRGRIFVFPWGVELERFCPAGPLFGLRRQKNWERKFIVLSTRSLAPVYGAETLMHAAVDASNRNPDLRFVFAGGGPQESWCRRFVAGEGVADAFCFLGRLPEEQMPGLFRDCDLYISTSRTDGTSISLLQAFASARPVVVSDLPANREWVTPGKTGWIVGADDPSAFSAAILAASDVDRTKLDAMGACARRVAENRGDWDNNFAVLCRAYEFAAVEPEDFAEGRVAGDELIPK